MTTPDAPAADLALGRPVPRPGAGWRLRFTRSIYRLAIRLNWAEPELNGLDAVVRRGDDVIDVGAALGMYSLPLASIVGRRGRVFSFEPQRRGYLTVGFLRALTGARGGTLTRLAMGASAGSATIVVPIYSVVPIFGHGHVADGSDDGSVRLTRERVPMDTIDAWVERAGIERVAFIKVDVEGFEPVVIDGARAVIDRDRPSLLMEIEDRHLVRYARTAAGFLAEIAERWPEYRMYTWSGRAWQRTDAVVPEIRNYLFATDEALARA